MLQQFKDLIFWMCENWLEAQFSFSQSSCLVKFSQLLPSIVTLGEFLEDAAQFNPCSLLDIGLFPIFASLWETKISGTPAKDTKRWWPLALQKKTGFSSRFEEMDTEIVTYYPFLVVVFVYLKVSSWTQIDS